MQLEKKHQVSICRDHSMGFIWGGSNNANIYIYIIYRIYIIYIIYIYMRYIYIYGNFEGISLIFCALLGLVSYNDP